MLIYPLICRNLDFSFNFIINSNSLMDILQGCFPLNFELFSSISKVRLLCLCKKHSLAFKKSLNFFPSGCIMRHPVELGRKNCQFQSHKHFLPSTKKIEIYLLELRASLHWENHFIRSFNQADLK